MIFQIADLLGQRVRTLTEDSLKKLKQRNPEKYKEVCEKIAQMSLEVNMQELLKT